MPKLKLDLDNKDSLALRTFATEHKDAMAGNANFPGPNPTALVYDADLTLFSDKLDEIVAARDALTALELELVPLENKVRSNVTLRGASVLLESGGVPAKIVTSHFELATEGVPTTSMPQPSNVVASIGDAPGEADIACNAVRKAKSYIWQCREHMEGQAPGPWTQAKISGLSKVTVGGLVSGRNYAFRVMVLGPNETESIWSDEAISMAA